MFLTNYLKQIFGSVQGQIFKTTNYAFNTRGKKLAWVAIFAVVFFLYWSSSRLMPAHRHLVGGLKQGVPCLQRELDKWTKLADSSNVVIAYPDYDSREKQFFPFTGNGYIGIVVDGKDQYLYLLRDQQNFPVKIPLPAILQVKLKLFSFITHDAVVLNIKEGIVHFHRAYAGFGSCVLVKHSIFAHRRHNGIIVQQITVSNLLEQDVGVELQPISNNKWKKSVKEDLSFRLKNNEKDTHALFHGFLESDSLSSRTFAAVSVSSYPSQLSIPVKSFKQLNVLTMVATNQIPVVMSTPASKSEARKEMLMNEAIQSSKKGLRQFLGVVKPSIMMEDHIKAWNEIWELGLSVESQDDPDSPLPLHVNLTEYYIYSITTFNKNGSNDIDLDAKRKRQLELQTLTGSCFFGSPTMYSAENWVLPKSVGGLKTLLMKWTKTLEEHGCSQLLKAGLFGWQEAIALSFSGLQFTDRGLELALNPLSLASNVSVRHLPCFKRQIFLQIVIDKSHDIQNVQLSSYGAPKSKLYACDAGCEHISELKTAVIIFEIRVTSPVTPILYVSPNKTKLELIKKSKFILMSKQGSSKAGNIPSFAAHHFKLSPKFWLAVGILIFGFHIIVIKMIYNECRKDRGRRSKGRPFVS